jgi:putative ABC transport system substrate-binding protein
VRSVRAQQPAKQHRIAIVVPAGPVARHQTLSQAILEELRRLGDVEGQNLTVERYSGEGRPEGFADLARDVVRWNVIIASTEPIARAIRAVSTAIPIVWIGGDPIQAGFATSFAHPGGNITGVSVFAGYEIYGKRLQILKEAVPSASKVVFLVTPIAWEGGEGQALRDASRRLEISVVGMPLQEVTATEVRRAFAEIAEEQPDAIMVHGIADLFAHHQLIVELIEKSRLPAMYEWREYVEAGGLMAYASDLGELGRRMADDVHAILNGAKPGDIPIYQPTKFELVINLKAAQAIGLTISPALLCDRRRGHRVSRRNFAAGLVLADTTRMVRAQEPAKQHRIAIIRTADPVAVMSDTGDPFLARVFPRAAPARRCRRTKSHDRAVFRRREAGGLCRSRSPGRRSES